MATAADVRTHETAAPLPGPGVEWSKVRTWAVVAGVGMAFVGAIGMVETFNNRLIIDPILSLGYIALFFFPVIAGWASTRRVERTGVETVPHGPTDVLAGVTVGVVAGVIAAFFTFLADAVVLTDIFPRYGSRMVEVMTFGLGLGSGLVLLIVVSAATGAVGSAIHLLPRSARRGFGAAMEWVFAVSLFQGVVEDVLDMISPVVDLLYTREDALSIAGAIVVAAIAWFVSIRFRGKAAEFRAAAVGKDQSGRLRFSLWGAVAVGALFFGLPLVLGGVLNELLSNVGLFLLMGLGLNIVVGLAGLLDLGYVAFFAVGAYTTAVLTSPLSPRFSPELSFWVALPIVIVIATIAGILVGTPVIRMRGDYLAIVTLGFGEIVRILLLSDWLSPTFGGAQGIRRIPGIDVGFTEIDGTEPQLFVYAILAFVVIAAYVSWRIQDSRVGRAWAAMREDEDVAEAIGVNTVQAKLLAFITGAILASFGGALFATKVGSVFTNSFDVLVSIIILVVVIVGGMGNIPGVAVGALVLIGVLGGPRSQGLLLEFQEFKLLIYGALLVFMMLQRPEGLVPSARRSRELHQEEFLQDAWLEGAPREQLELVDEANA